jgi:hypothetical protein
MPKFLAIDADAHGLILAVGSAARGSLNIDRLIAATDLIQPLSPATAPLIGERLKQLLKDGKLGTPPALVAIGRDRVILKDVKHPPVPPADEPGVVRFQALKELGEGADDGIIDYTPMEAAGNERKAAVAFLRRDMAAAVRTVCEIAGLKIQAMTPRPHAAVAVLNDAATNGRVPPPDPVDGPVAVVLITEAGGEFTVCRNGAMTFSRAIPAGAVASEGALLAELRRNLAVVAGQAGEDVQAIYLAEAEQGAAGWSARLRAELGVPVYAMDPLAGIAQGEPIPAPLHGRFLGPVGLLLARGATGPLPINFATPRQPRRTAETTPQKKRMMMAALAAAVLFGALALGGYFLNEAAEAKVRSLRKQITEVEELTKQGELVAKRLAAVEEFRGREVVWLDELYDQAEMVPDGKKMKLVNWEGKVTPLPTDKERAAAAQSPPTKNSPPKRAGTLTMTMTSDDPNLVEKQVAAIERDRRFYVGTSKSTKPLVGGGKSNVQQFVIDTGIAARKPSDYTKRLVAVLPKLPDPVPDEKKDDEKKESKDEKKPDETTGTVPEEMK